MGQRHSRYKKKKLTGHTQPTSNQVAVSLPVTIEEKNDTIPKTDFFGFSPKIYWQDLKRTGVATVAIVVLLFVIYFLSN